MKRTAAFLAAIALGACASPEAPRPVGRVAALKAADVKLQLSNACRGTDLSAPLDERIAALWPRFDKALWREASGTIAEMNSAFFFKVLPAANDLVSAPGDAAKRKAWEARVAEYENMMVALGYYQLALMRCYVGDGRNPPRLVQGDVKAAMRSLALGTHATDPADPSKGRMNGLHGWLQWAQFVKVYQAASDQAFEDFAPEDRTDWAAMPPHLLYGFLLHLYHDTLCPGPHCQPKPKVVVEGLHAVDQQALEAYAYSVADPQRLLDGIYAQLLAQKFTPHRLPPQFK